MPESLERFWEDLLLFVEEGKVIPVIGPELVTVEEDGTSIPLYHWLARSLAERIDLPLADLPDPFDLNDVVAQSIRNGDERDELYPRLLQILRKAPTTLSPGLCALASIPNFKLFVSLTIDSQLELALARACHGVMPRTIACATNAVHDLPEPYEDLDEQVIVQLLGRASSTPDYAICDEDLLEFLHALQDGQRRPVKLFDALRANHLLFLGCGFGDWLARYFLRTARGMALSQKRKRWVVMADDRAASEPSLAEFLSCFSADSHVLEMSASAFVEELSQRWHATHPLEAGTEAGAMQATAGETGPREGAVFVSYASEDRSTAERLVDGLRAARLEVWFDQRELRRCRVHFLRNLLSHVPKAGQDMVAAAMKAVFVIQAARDDVLAFLHFPKEHWRKIWSSNVVGIFPNDPAIVRLVGSQLLEQQEEWQLERRRLFSEATMAKIPQPEEPLELPD